jgi:hypothetical protein
MLVRAVSCRANLQCGYSGGISPTVGTCSFMGKPVRPVADPTAVTPVAAQAMIDGVW